MYWPQFSLAPENKEEGIALGWPAFLITLFKYTLAHKHTHTDSDVEACLVMEKHSNK